MSFGTSGSGSYGELSEAYAVVSDLTGEACEQVLRIWDRLEARFGLRSVRAGLLPHVVYAGGEGADPSALAAALAAATADLEPFEVRLQGLDLVEGSRPTLSLRVELCPGLERTHARVLRVVEAAGMVVGLHHLPGQWTPRVTLATADLEPAILPAVLEELRTMPMVLTSRLESLRLVRMIRAERPQLSFLPLPRDEGAPSSAAAAAHPLTLL